MSGVEGLRAEAAAAALREMTESGGATAPMVRKALAAACQEDRADVVASLGRGYLLPRESVRDGDAARLAMRHESTETLRQLAGSYGLLPEDLRCLARRALKPF